MQAPSQRSPRLPFPVTICKHRSCRNEQQHRPEPILPQSFESEPAQPLPGIAPCFPLRVLCDSLATPSSISRPRTSVLNLPIPLRQWFFLKPRAHSLHDRASATRLPPPPRISLVHIFYRDLARLRANPPRRYTRCHPLRSRRRVLLQMRSIQNEIGLHKNV